VQGRPLWLWLRLCLMGKLARDAFLGSVAGLDDSARVELAKRATDNAYQLMRRWPLPGDITPAIEDEDATQLYDLLLPVLEPISAKEREAAISREQEAKVKNPGLVLLLSFGQASHGEPVTAKNETLKSALRLSTALGMRFLTALSAIGRLELIEAIQLVPNNLDGWPYLELLEQSDRQRVVLTTLARFDRPAKPNVGAHISELVRTFDSAAHAELRKLAEQGGPNAKLIEAALNKQSDRARPDSSIRLVALLNHERRRCFAYRKSTRRTPRATRVSVCSFVARWRQRRPCSRTRTRQRVPHRRRWWATFASHPPTCPMVPKISTRSFRS